MPLRPKQAAPAHSTLLPPAPALIVGRLLPAPGSCLSPPEDAPGLRPPLGKRWAGRCIVDPLQWPLWDPHCRTAVHSQPAGHPVAIVSGPTMAPASHCYCYSSLTPTLSARYGPVLVSCGDIAIRCGGCKTWGASQEMECAIDLPSDLPFPQLPCYPPTHSPTCPRRIPRGVSVPNYHVGYSLTNNPT